MEYLLGALILYFGGAGLLGLVPVNRDFAPTPGGVPVCLRSNGIHTDVVLPATGAAIDWRAELPKTDFPRMRRAYDSIAFGWGERQFYLETPTWADLKAGTALVAATGLGDAALHVEYADRPRPGERAACTRVNEAQYRALVAYIERTFARDAAGRPRRIDAPGYGAADAFYEAKGTFSIFVTCNEWVRDGLAASGIRAPAWSPFDGALLRQLRDSGPPPGGGAEPAPGGGKPPGRVRDTPRSKAGP